MDLFYKGPVITFIKLFVEEFITSGNRRAADGFASHMPLPFAGATGWFCDEGPAQRLPKLNFSSEEEIASDQ